MKRLVATVAMAGGMLALAGCGSTGHTVSAPVATTTPVAPTTTEPGVYSSATLPASSGAPASASAGSAPATTPPASSLAVLQVSAAQRGNKLAEEQLVSNLQAGDSLSESVELYVSQVADASAGLESVKFSPHSRTGALIVQIDEDVVTLESKALLAEDGGMSVTSFASFGHDLNAAYSQLLAVVKASS